MAQKLLIAEPGKVMYEELPLGEPGPGEVRARTVLSGISHGTEMTAFQGISPFVKRTITAERTFRDKGPDDPSFYPFPWAGYDAVGVVDAVGAGVTRYQSGDRVWCQMRHQTAFLFNEAQPDAIPLPDSVPDAEAIMTNLTSVALGAIHDAAIKVGDTVVISGGGTVGQLATELAWLNGAGRVILLEPSAARRAFAEGRSPVLTLDPLAAPPAPAIRAANHGNAPDVVVECSGVVAGLATAIAVAGVAGTVIAAGFYAGSAAALHLDEELMHNRVTIKASMSKWGCPSRFLGWDEGRLLRSVIELLAARRLHLDGYLTATFPFLEAQAAYEAIARAPERYLKVALTY